MVEQVTVIDHASKSMMPGFPKKKSHTTARKKSAINLLYVGGFST
jgi:hypothetical protein